MNKTDENKHRNHDADTDISVFDRKKKHHTRAKKERTKRKIGCGAILAFLFAMSDALALSLRNGFFGNLFITLYARLNEKWKSGEVYRALARKNGENGRKRSLRVRFARIYEESLLGSLIAKISETVIHSSIRLWGLALFSFGFVMVFVAMVKYYFTSIVMLENIVVGMIVGVISFPLVLSKKRLGSALIQGRASRFVMTRVLSLDVTKFEAAGEGAGGNYGVTFVISSALGLLTYFVSPMIMISVFLIVSVFAIVMCFPELGITSVLALIPFSNIFEHPSATMFMLIVFSFLGFASKYIRGKRVLKMELLDASVLIFSALMLLGGVFTAGGLESTYSAIMYTVFLLMYFLVVNSYIRKTWIYRGIKLVVISTSIVAVIGVFEDGVISSSWVDMSAFSDIGARISSFLGNPNMLGVYLVIVFPLILAQMIVSDRIRSKLGYAIGALAVAVCTVMTWSRGAWLGIIVTTVLFLVLYNFKSIWLIAAGIVTSPIWFSFLPESVIKRFMSILSMSDTSILYRFNTWRGVLNMIWDNILSGIGVGESAFKNVYSLYAVSGTETVMHSHNLYLEITLSLGIVGTVVFAAIIVMYSQKCFADITRRRVDSKSRIMISAGLSGIAGALVMGLVDYIWYNYRVFLIFWSVIALTVALTKINENENAKENAISIGNIKSADIDIYC